MTQATYNVAIDINRDGFFAAGVSITDALNVIPTPVRHEGISTAVLNSATSVTATEGVTLYGHLYYRVVSGTTVNAGMRFGGATVDDIAVNASSTYRAIVWVRAVDTPVGMTFEVYDEDGASVGSTTFTPTNDWGQVVCNVSTGAGSTYVEYRIRKTNSATDVTFDVTGFMLVEGSTAPSVFNTGDASDAHNEITPYVHTMNWSNGVSDSYAEFARPNRATIVVNNAGGEFFQEQLADNSLLNSAFPHVFASGDLVDWTEVGESGGNEITEVGLGETHGGSGSGCVNLYTTGTQVGIRQDALVVGTRYKVSLFVDTVNAGAIQVYCGSRPVSPRYHQSGTKTFYFTAHDDTFAIYSVGGACDVTLIGSVVQAGSRYMGVGRSTPVRIMASFFSVGDQQLYVGKLSGSFRIDPGMYSQRLVTMVADDMLSDLLTADYEPELETDIRTDQAMQSVFDAIDIIYPPAQNFWLLGAEGSSELGISTVLFEGNFTDFDTGATTLAYVGDNQDKGGGVNARSYLEEIVKSEMGGRFYWDTRTNKFAFISRHTDLLNDSVAFSLTEDELDEGDYRYGDTVINTLTVNFTPREIGDEGAVVWEATDVPFTLKPFETKVIKARFRDPDQQRVVMSVINPLRPVIGEDIVIQTNASVGYMRSTLNVSVTYTSNAAEISITNRRAINRTVTVLRLRGTPLFAYDKRFVDAIDPTSIRDNDVCPAKIDLSMVTDEDDVNAFAPYYLSRFKDRTGRYASLTFIANKSTQRMIYALGTTVGTRMALADSQTGHDADYIVVGEKHDVRAGADHTHRVTWITKNITREAYWVLGEAGYSELGSSTKLAF